MLYGDLRVDSCVESPVMKPLLFVKDRNIVSGLFSQGYDSYSCGCEFAQMAGAVSFPVRREQNIPGKCIGKMSAACI